MGIVTALKLSPTLGVIGVDQESWYLNRRRTFFNDLLFPLNLPEFSEAFQVNFVYGAVGNPNFHLEVMTRARQEIQEKWKKGYFSEGASLLTLSRFILKAFQQTWRRRIDNQLQFYYGFTTDDLNRGYFFNATKEKVLIKNGKVKQYALDFVNQKEKLFFGTLPTPNQVCLIGVDPEHQFSAYCIKEDQGVLSFQSGGFESLGDGCYAGAMEISKELNRLFLETRRQGCGILRGILTLLRSILEASEHYAKIGGNVRFMLLDANAPTQLIEIRDSEARLASEIAKAFRAQLLSLESAEQLLDELIFQKLPWTDVESHLFQRVSNRATLDRLLRQYKMNQTFEIASPHPLFTKEQNT